MSCKSTKLGKTVDYIINSTAAKLKPFQAELIFIQIFNDN